MANDIPATPRLLEGTWYLFDGKTDTVHLAHSGPEKYDVVTLCGKKWKRDQVGCAKGVARDYYCRRCLQSLKKWEAK